MSIQAKRIQYKVYNATEKLMSDPFDSLKAASQWLKENAIAGETYTIAKDLSVQTVLRQLVASPKVVTHTLTKAS